MDLTGAALLTKHSLEPDLHKVIVKKLRKEVIKSKIVVCNTLEQWVLESMGLQTYFDRGGYALFAQEIEKLIGNGLLKPVGKECNGRNPPLPARLRILPHGVSPELRQIQENIFSLQSRCHAWIDLSYYTRHPLDFETDGPLIFRLNDWLKNNRQAASEYVSLNERSFEIFRNEKFLHEEGAALLGRIGLSHEQLACTQTREPFFYRETNGKTEDIALIIENRDTFFSLKEIQIYHEKTHEFFPWRWLIYGEGKKIFSSISFFCDIHDISSQSTAMEYFGDLDPEGLTIWYHLRCNTSFINIEPSIELYSYLIDQTSLDWPELRRQQRTVPDALFNFLTYLSQEHSTIVTKNFRQNNYLPQEALSRPKLREIVKRICKKRQLP